jgi:hypothetical protein
LLNDEQANVSRTVSALAIRELTVPDYEGVDGPRNVGLLTIK